MKWKKKNSVLLLVFCFLAATCNVFSQEAEKSTLSLNLGYFVKNNNAHYVVATAQTRIEGRFYPVKDIEVNIYLDSAGEENLIGKFRTDDNGKAKSYLPLSLKNKWDASSTHTFIAMADANKQFDEATGELIITKSKIEIDTVSDETTKSITVTISKYENNEWLPLKDVDIKIGVKRMGGILVAGEEEVYTTDSTGSVIAEFSRDSLPGDKNGNIILAAKVDDNDEVGNLYVEKTVPWGIAFNAKNNFFQQRTLWSTRHHTPIWLLFIAYSIIIAVWGTIIYLILQLFKIRKLGTVKGKSPL